MSEEKVPYLTETDDPDAKSGDTIHCCSEAMKMMKEKMNTVIDDISSRAGVVGAKFHEGTSRAGEYTKAGLHRTEEGIKHHPMSSILTAIGVGVAIGFLLAWRGNRH